MNDFLVTTNDNLRNNYRPSFMTISHNIFEISNSVLISVYSTFICHLFFATEVGNNPADSKIQPEEFIALGLQQVVNRNI